MVAALAFVNTNAGTATEANTLTDTTVPTVVMATAATGRSYIVASTTSVREIRSPPGGIMQFRGLTQGTTNDQYVEVICRGV